MATRQLLGRETEMVGIHSLAGLLQPRLWGRPSMSIWAGNALCCPCLLTITLVSSLTENCQCPLPCCSPTSSRLTFQANATSMLPLLHAPLLKGWEGLLLWTASRQREEGGLAGRWRSDEKVVKQTKRSGTLYSYLNILLCLSILEIEWGHPKV